MKTVLIISDSHKDDKIVLEVLKNEKYDISIHLGDSQSSDKFLEDNFDYHVAGNIDKFEAEVESIIDIEGVEIAITHGDKYEASLKELWKFNERVSRYKLIKLCRDIRADVVLYGHSHMRDDTTFKTLRLINPGSIAYPRDDRRRSYAIMTIKDKENINVEFKFV